MKGFRSIRSGLLAAVLATSLPACNHGDASAPPPNTVAPAVESRVPDRVDDDGRVRKDIFYPKNPVTRERVAAAREWDAVEDAMGVYAALGYVPAPEHSCAVDGITEKSRIEMTILALRSLADPNRVAVVVAIEMDAGRVVLPLEFARGPDAEAGFESVGESFWMRRFETLGAVPGSERLDSEQVNAFLNCVCTAVPTLMAECGMACYILPVGWVQCVEVCLGSRLVTTVVHCLEVAFAPKKERQQPCANCEND